jgi:catechol 2,3-dioxygenase-like lactoylglutathione lyase family enzyme
VQTTTAISINHVSIHAEDLDHYVQPPLWRDTPISTRRFMKLERIDHFTIRTHDLEATRAFYEAALGLSIGWRPSFPFPGYWLHNGTDSMIHIAARSGTEQLGVANGGGGLSDYLGTRDGKGSGALDHIAIRASNALAFLRRLEAAAVPYRERIVPDLKEWQIFVVDPNDVTIELIFSSSEVPPGAARAAGRG